MALRKLSYKKQLEQKMDQLDYQDHKMFLAKAETGFNDDDLKVVFNLHAKYFQHDYYEPCGCGGARKMDQVNRMMSDLTHIYNNGLET